MHHNRNYMILALTVSAAKDQFALDVVERVEVPVCREVGQEAGGRVVGLGEESLDVAGGVAGEAPGHDEHCVTASVLVTIVTIFMSPTCSVIVANLDHLLLPFALASEYGLPTTENEEWN